MDNGITQLQDRPLRGQTVVLYNTDTGKYHPMRLYCRGMPQYHARQGDKFDLIADYAKTNLPGAFLTLSPRAHRIFALRDTRTDERIVNSLFVQYDV